MLNFQRIYFDELHLLNFQDIYLNAQKNGQVALRHDSMKAKYEKICNELHLQNFLDIFLDSYGRSQPTYLLEESRFRWGLLFKR